VNESGTDAKGRILVVDDDDAVAIVLCGLLEQDGHHVERASTGSDALRRIVPASIDVILSDVRMPGMSGMELLERARAAHPEVPVVMLTAHGSVPLAVEAMRAGATDFLTKPFEREEVLRAIAKAMALVVHDDHAPAANADGDRLLGESHAMQALRERIARVAPTDATVLIRGETGTGKELAARALHRASKRAAGPMVAVNCAALPENLLESELFGHARGAFTGAVTSKPGRVELAQGGTLFLDEIGETSPALQAKLLRLLQEREYQPVGSTATRRADVRFLAATHQDLEARVSAGEFREDLYFRLAVVPLHVPALRERRSDVRVLARAFFARARGTHGRKEWRLDDDALDALASMPWPGNVRELLNAIERLLILGDGPTIGASEVARLLGKGDAASDLRSRMREAERSVLMEALESSENRAQAARVLGISRRTLYNKLEEHGLL
jgi:DNA-binding NtrC family response regulator